MDGHEFCSDDVDCVSAAFSSGVQITGHRQVTDAYLPWLARARSGCLATLDRRISRLLPAGGRPDPHLRIVDAHCVGVKPGAATVPAGVEQSTCEGQLSGPR